MTHTPPLGPITHKRARKGRWSALSTPSLISPCHCLSAKTSCHMQNACIAFEAICQRVLRPLFTALCSVPASEMAGNSKEHALSSRINDLYLFWTRGNVWKKKGCCSHARVMAWPQLSFSLSYWFWIIFWQSVFHGWGGGDGMVTAVMNKSSSIT